MMTYTLQGSTCQHDNQIEMSWNQFEKSKGVTQLFEISFRRLRGSSFFSFYSLLRLVVSAFKSGKPPLGFYWIGSLGPLLLVITRILVFRRWINLRSSCHDIRRVEIADQQIAELIFRTHLIVGLQNIFHRSGEES